MLLVIDAGNTNIVFAVQSTVPSTLDDRISVLRWLAESARRHPGSRVVVKVNCVSVQWRTSSTRSVPIAAKIAFPVRRSIGRECYRESAGAMSLRGYSLIADGYRLPVALRDRG